VAEERFCGAWLAVRKEEIMLEGRATLLISCSAAIAATAAENSSSGLRDTDFLLAHFSASNSHRQILSPALVCSQAGGFNRAAAQT